MKEGSMGHPVAEIDLGTDIKSMDYWEDQGLIVLYQDGKTAFHKMEFGYTYDCDIYYTSYIDYEHQDGAVGINNCLSQYPNEKTKTRMAAGIVLLILIIFTVIILITCMFRKRIRRAI